MPFTSFRSPVIEPPLLDGATCATIEVPLSVPSDFQSARLPEESRARKYAAPFRSVIPERTDRLTEESTRKYWFVAPAVRYSCMEGVPFPLATKSEMPFTVADTLFQ